MAHPDTPKPTRWVASGDGSLAVWERGHGEPIVFVHGYPDTHRLWDPVIDRLADEYRCVSYDVRGAGQSMVPAGRREYRLDVLMADLAAVVEAVSPDKPVHLVGHDWGSVQCWDAVVCASGDRLAGRVASYTSISGPCLIHAGAFMRRRNRDVLRQLARSWYVGFFQLPLLPELFVRATFGRLARRTGTRVFDVTLVDDAVNGLNLYRANLIPAAHATVDGKTDVPIQLIVPTQDKYISVPLAVEAERFCSDLTRVDIDAGHWVQRSHPADVASAIRRHVRPAP